MKFTEMPYSRPDIDALIAQCNEAVAKFAAAESAQEQIEIFADIDKKKCELFDMESIVYIRNSVNMNDEFYAAEREYLDNNLPRLSEASNALNKEMLNSKFQAELRKDLKEKEKKINKEKRSIIKKDRRKEHLRVRECRTQTKPPGKKQGRESLKDRQENRKESLLQKVSRKKSEEITDIMKEERVSKSPKMKSDVSVS